MAKKEDDWKAEAKKLKDQVKRLRKTIEDRVLPALSETVEAGVDAVIDAVASGADAVSSRVKQPSPVSPLAPMGGFPALPVIDGVEFAAVEAGVRYKNRTDVMLVRLAPGTADNQPFDEVGQHRCRRRRGTHGRIERGRIDREAAPKRAGIGQAGGGKHHEQESRD